VGLSDTGSVSELWLNGIYCFWKGTAIPYKDELQTRLMVGRAA